MTIVFLLFLLGDYIGHLINELEFPSPKNALFAMFGKVVTKMKIKMF